MTVLMIYNSEKEKAKQAALKAVQILESAGVKVYISRGNHADISTESSGNTVVPIDLAFNLCDLIITVGGDGTMLHAARKAMIADKPLLGINTGRLGFLTLIENNELENLLRLPEGNFSVDRRSVLQAKFGTDKSETDHALNDIVLFKEYPEKTIALDIYCGDVLVSSFRGDGVIFSTPTGSTAYSMSSGGPIVDAKVSGFIVTHICPHIVYSPPMVFAADRIIKVVSRGSADERVMLGCDGLKSRLLPPDEPVWIGQSPLTVSLVQFDDAEQLKSIDKKLKGR